MKFIFSYQINSNQIDHKYEMPQRLLHNEYVLNIFPLKTCSQRGVMF